jgi:hypothetical protein
MGKKLMDILKGAGAMGLFAGLYALTGHDLDPQNIVVGVVDLIVGSMGGKTGADITQLWDQVKVGLLIYGLIGTVLFVVSVLYCGERGIIAVVCGYFGVLLLITGLGHGITALYLPVALLAIGYVAAKYLSDRGTLKLR